MINKTHIVQVKTTKRDEMINVTNQIIKIVEESKVRNGLVVLFVPHTTAAITINENADPDVKRDFLHAMNRISPDLADFAHYEGNSDAHVKSSIIGVDQTILLDDGQLLLGTWQGVYFCEFDGPRMRNLYVRVMG